MDDLVKLVSAKLGLSEDIARQAVLLIVGQLKDKLPAPIAGQIDGLLGGDTGSADSGNLLDQGKNLLGGILGGGN